MRAPAILQHWPTLGALAALLILPVALRPAGDSRPLDDKHTLVIITPHNEAIRYEFGRAFAAYYLRKTGQPVYIDWRTPGGTSEIARYLRSEYLSAFLNHWKRHFGRSSNSVVERAWENPKIVLDDTPGDDTEEHAARRAFLSSDVGCRMDLFFGGGTFDFISQANAGRLVDSGFVRAHPELFSEQQIPQSAGGEPLWDAKGRWIGACLSGFGICSNLDALRRLGLSEPPARWTDLANPRYFHEIALANPTQSGSVNRAFEMLIQQQMLERVRAAESSGQSESDAVAEGWSRALQLIMQISANARYFTDSASKIALDVTDGEAAAGMAIDFYGRFQSEAVRKADNTSRVYYCDAVGGTSMGADPIGMLRGAPHPELAREFIAFVLSQEGQKLWNWKVGTPGGPERYALRRLPVLPTLYQAEFRESRSDPDVDPYRLADTFTYREQWTGPLFRSIAFIVRVMCIDSHDELTAAWRTVIEAGRPDAAMTVLTNVSAVDYAKTQALIRPALSGDKIREVALAKELADHFRAQYRNAAEIARSGAASRNAAHRSY